MIPIPIYELLQSLFSHLFQHSLWQRRELRGDVRPRQPPERGHPAQLCQHLQRRQLLLHDPGRLRPVQRRHHHIKPEHRGDPVSAFGELIIPKLFSERQHWSAVASSISLTNRGKGFSFSFSFGPCCFLKMYSWLLCLYLIHFVLSWQCFLENANVFSGIDEDKRTGTLGVRCKTSGSKMFFCICVIYLLIFICFFYLKSDQPEGLISELLETLPKCVVVHL